MPPQTLKQKEAREWSSGSLQPSDFPVLILSGCAPRLLLLCPSDQTIGMQNSSGTPPSGSQD